MANGKMTPEQMAQLSRASLKNLIVKFNAAGGKDKSTLQMIIEQLAKTPLYFAVQKGSTETAGSLNFVTLATGGKVFVPIFTGPEEFGKVIENADAVCLTPEAYFRMLSDNDRSGVINPFGSYFLLWPELVRDHLLPFLASQKPQITELKS